MSDEHIEIEMKPQIIAKPSPTFSKIDAKAVAGLSQDDIIERNVIGEFEEDDDEQPDDAKTDV